MPKNCPQCQTEASDTAGFCRQCGGSLPATSAPGPTAEATRANAAANPAGSVPQYKFEASRWSTSDRITGTASVVLLISLFLPWFSASFDEVTIRVSGLSAHGFLYLVLFIVIALLAYLVARAGWDKLPVTTSVAHAPVMLVASLVNLAFVVIAFIWMPSGGFGWAFGAVLALIAAIVAAFPIAVPAIRSRSTGK